MKEFLTKTKDKLIELKDDFQFWYDDQSKQVQIGVILAAFLITVGLIINIFG